MKSWRTTVLGILVGGVYMLIGGLQQGLSLKDAAISIGIALLGAVAKDFNVTGN